MILQTGATVLNGKYRIDAFIGQGASARVYRATHVRLSQTRALKALRKDAPGVGSSDYADYRQRFQLEAQLGAKIRHDHVIQVFDFEEDGDLLLLTMEYAAGGSLVDRLARLRGRNERMPVEEAVGVALDAAMGLAAIHDQDAVHRDLKPSNILLDVNGRGKVADLGLAQMPGGSSMRSRLSTAQPHPGTPAYMSPEQESSSVYLRPNADVYALGLILFEMLTGRAYKNLEPGTRAAALRREMPKELDDLLARMLSQNPASRPFDGNRVANELGAIGVSPTWRRDDAWLRERTVAESIAPLASAQKESAQVKVAPEAVEPKPIERPTHADVVAAPLKDDPIAHERAPEHNAGAAPVQPTAPAKTQRPAASKTWPVIGIIAAAIVLAALLFLPGLISQSSASSNYSSGMTHMSNGEYASAQSAFDAAILAKPGDAEAHYARGVARFYLKQFDDAIADFSQALGIKPNFVEAYYERGVAHAAKGEFNQAIAEYEQAIKVNPDYADAYYGLGLAHLNKGNNEQAVTNLQRYLSLGNDPTLRAISQDKLRQLGATP